MKNFKIIFYANVALVGVLILFGAGCADLPKTPSPVPQAVVEDVVENNAPSPVENLVEEAVAQPAPPVVERSAPASKSVPAPIPTPAKVEVTPTPAPQETGPEPTPIAPTAPVVATPTPEPEVTTTCCKYCKTSKACGDSCISKSYNCTKPPGCACNAY